MRSVARRHDQRCCRGRGMRTLIIEKASTMPMQTSAPAHLCESLAPQRQRPALPGFLYDALSDGVGLDVLFENHMHAACGP